MADLVSQLLPIVTLYMFFDGMAVSTGLRFQSCVCVCAHTTKRENMTQLEIVRGQRLSSERQGDVCTLNLQYVCVCVCVCVCACVRACVRE